jgi:hypothetical protein
VLRQLADAGTLFLTLSGGEVLLRTDFFDIVRLARSLLFCVRVKTNGVFNDSALAGSDAICSPPSDAPDPDAMDGTLQRGSHGLLCLALWRRVPLRPISPADRKRVESAVSGHLARLAEVRAIRVRDLTTCPDCAHVGSCTRCPGLAFMEGSMRGPSSLDCAKSFARTGVPSAGMLTAAPATFIPIDRVGRR